MRIFNSKAMISLGLILGMTLLFQNCGKGFGSLKAGKQLLGSTGLRTSSVVLCPANYTKQGELCIPPSTDRVGGTHFGILYMLWHCPFSQSSQNPSGQIFDLSQLLPQGQTGPIGGWHWWDRPADRGYYCLSENNEVLKKHAIELRDAGIDFIVVDSTNHPTTDGQSDRPQEMIVRPFANLLRVWSEIPGAPRVLPWVPVTNHTQPMVDHLLGLLANYPHLQYIKDGKPYFLVTNNPAEVLKVNGAKLSQLAMNYSYDKMWAINTKTLEPKEFSYLSPCRGDFKASGGTTTCDQFITSHNGIKEHVSISAGVNQFLMSEPTQSTPRFQGRTLARQFETLFKNPEIRLATITSYNEWLAINHCAAKSGGLTGDPNQCSSSKSHFVDLYNGEYSRDIEPSTTLGDKYYRLTKACISRFKRGMTTCDANSADEVRSVPMGETMADSVERACSYPGHTNLPAQITTGQVFGFMDRIRWSNGRAVLGGWACRVGDAREIDVHVYLDGPAGKGVFSKTGKTQISSEAAIHAACGTPEGIKHRFEVDVTDLVGTSSGRSIYVHAIDPQGGANYFLHNSGSCAVPWPGVDTPPPMPQYSWAVSDWSGCSSNPQWQVSAWSSCMNGSMSRTVSCNGRDGQDSRQVVCRRDDGQVVADNFCAGSKPEMSKSCQKECSGATPSTMQPCEEAVKFTYDWDVGAWGSCSAMPSWELGAWSACTGGTQTRPVACIHTLGLQQRNVQCRRSDGVMVTSGCSGAMPSREMECRSTCQSMAPEASRSCSMPEIPKVTIHRLYQPTGIEHLFSTNANEGASAGFVYEGAPFRLYQRQESSTVALHRCWVPGWKHFVTTDGNCEGQQKDGILGYISTVEIPGTVPLYRRYHPTVQDHLVTTFRNEGAEAGYIEVSVLGYVFTP